MMAIRIAGTTKVCLITTWRIEDRRPDLRRLDVLLLPLAATEAYEESRCEVMVVSTSRTLSWVLHEQGEGLKGNACWCRAP